MVTINPDSETKELLLGLSKNVQDIGRRIASTKNTKEDLEILSDALETSTKTLWEILSLV